MPSFGIFVTAKKLVSSGNLLPLRMSLLANFEFVTLLLGNFGTRNNVADSSMVFSQNPNLYKKRCTFTYLETIIITTEKE